MADEEKTVIANYTVPGDPDMGYRDIREAIPRCRARTTDGEDGQVTVMSDGTTSISENIELEYYVDPNDRPSEAGVTEGAPS